jgi:predicted PhzF superfamily epimerase YddE/YHI9
VRIRIVDAFTDRPFAGNPAGVCLLEAWPEEDWMRAVAGELNLSEAAHVIGGSELRFHTRSGVLVARVADEITLDFPANRPVPRAAPDDLAAALRAEPGEVLWVPALRELFAVIADERTVRELAPGLAAVARFDGCAEWWSPRRPTSSTSCRGCSCPRRGSRGTR